MPQVLALVKSGVKDDQAAATILSCHVSFTMDIPTLDQLDGERLMPPVFDALNRDTLSRLSVEEAHSEVAAIESYLSNSTSGTAPAAQPVRAKIEADFQAKMAAYQNVTGKGEFETEADYRDRLMRSQEGLGAIREGYDASIASYYRFFTSRISLIEAASYGVADKSALESYDADAQIMRVQINGAEYVFSGVVPDVAKNYSQLWSQVQTGRRYDDDGTRFLYFTRTGSRLLGQPAQKVQDQRAAGVWVDSQTGLMWTIRSSSTPMHWGDAAIYCDTLPLAGFSDWQMPAIEQLDTLVADPRRRGVKGAISIAAPDFRTVWSETDPTYDQQVTSTLLEDSPGHYVNGLVRYNGYWLFSIPLGERAHSMAGMGMPTLCVRHADAGPPPQSPPVRFPDRASALNRAEADFYGQKYAEAFPLSEIACKAGDRVGCTLEGYLDAFGLGHPADAARGMDLMTKACDSGLSIACDALGVAYLRGGPVPADQKRAFSLFVKSCVGGSDGLGGFGEGCVNAAECLLKGVGVHRDTQRAINAFDQSCSEGLDQFATACHDGDAESCKNLGRCYVLGNYLTKDLSTAKVYFERACALGDQAACAEVGNMH